MIYFILFPIQNHSEHLCLLSHNQEFTILTWKFKSFRNWKPSKSLAKLRLKMRPVHLGSNELCFLKLCLANMFIHYVTQIKAISSSCLCYFIFVLVSWFLFSEFFISSNYLILGQYPHCKQIRLLMSTYNKEKMHIALTIC